MKRSYLCLVMFLIALVLVALPLLAGCSKPAPSPTPAPAKPPAPAVTQAPATKPAAAPSPAPAPKPKTIELKFNVFAPSTHALWVSVFKPWVEELEKRAAGRVKVIPFFSGALAKQEENYDATVKRISDMSWGTQRITPGRFSLSELIYVPGLGLPDANAMTLAFMHIYSTFPEVRKQYEDSKVIFLVGLPPRVIGTTKKAVRTLEDLKGLKTWVSGKVAVDMVKALGATPVTMPAGEVYTSLEKGIVDAAGWPASSLTGNRLHDLLKYVTNVPLDGGTFYFVMNKDAYNGLPADIKKIVDDMSGDWAGKFVGERYKKADDDQWDVIRKKGIEIITPPSAEAARWYKAIEPVAEGEVAGLEAKGLPARKVHQELLRFAQQYKK